MTLLAAYNFDEASGDVLDATGSGHDFTLTGTDGARTASGHTDQGLTKTGTDDEVTIAPLFGQTALRTVMCWLATTNDAQAAYAVEWHVTPENTGTWGILQISGEIHIQARNASSFLRATAAMQTDGSWHHYAGTYDGSSIRLYVDGVLVATTALTGPLRTDADELRVMTGMSIDSFTDDLRVYDEALDQATIASLMNTPVSSGPVPVPAMTGTAVLTLSGTGTLAPVTATVPELTGTAVLTLSGTGTLNDPAPAVYPPSRDFWEFGQQVKVERPGGYDRYGQPLPVTTHTVDDCVWAPRTSTEEHTNRATTITGLALYGPYGADIQSIDTLYLPDGEGGWDPMPWYVEGDPGNYQNPFTGDYDGFEVDLTRNRG